MKDIISISMTREEWEGVSAALVIYREFGINYPVNFVAVMAAVIAQRGVSSSQINFGILHMLEQFSAAGIVDMSPNELAALRSVAESL